MSMPPEHVRFSVEEYFRRESVSETKHEYREGTIVMMAGGSRFHSLIITNLIGELRNRLKGKPCRAYESNLRIRIPRRTIYTYPDTSVICGEFQADPLDPSGGTALNPRLIVEVLSPSTESHDHTEKFIWYREIESLREYVLISQTSPDVQTFLRKEDGSWMFGPWSGLEAVTKLASIDVELPLREIYDGVTFPPPLSTQAAL